MPAVIVLGLRLTFRDLWTKVGVKKRAMCNCPDSPSSFLFCPYCGVRKATREIKVYRSRLTGIESATRDINSVREYLYDLELDVYDTDPQGFTDADVYIYLTNPVCLLEVNSTRPQAMSAMHDDFLDLEEVLRDKLGDELWEAGEFGLWTFIKKELTSGLELDIDSDDDSDFSI